jgi:tripartite-type tricarboxylate transporter receptor subunit TctC
VAEQGFPGFEMTQWYGLLAPARTPPAVLARLGEETQKAVRAESMRKRLADDTALPVGGPGTEFAAFIASEQKRWQPVIARARIKPD